MSTSTTSPRSVTLPSAPVFIGGVYAICVLGLLAIFVGNIILSDKDAGREDGPLESIISISVVSTVALVILGLVALWVAGKPERAKVGAIVLGGLSVVALIVFWSGAPGLLGAGAAWLAGLTRGGKPLGGAARVAGLAGAFIALLNIVLTVGGVLLSGIS